MQLCSASLHWHCSQCIGIAMLSNIDEVLSVIFSPGSVVFLLTHGTVFITWPCPSCSDSILGDKHLLKDALRGWRSGRGVGCVASIVKVEADWGYVISCWQRQWWWPVTSVCSPETRIPGAPPLSRDHCTLWPVWWCWTQTIFCTITLVPRTLDKKTIVLFGENQWKVIECIIIYYIKLNISITELPCSCLK